MRRPILPSLPAPPRLFLPRSLALVLILILSAGAHAETNHVDYQLDVTLDTETSMLSGSERLVYVNGTAERPLESLKFHLYQNAFRGSDSHMAQVMAQKMHDWTIHDLPEKDRGWMKVENLKVDGVPAPFEVDDTIMNVVLPHPLAAGDTVTLEMDYSWKISIPLLRAGHCGENYAIAQWYPQICRYEPGYGWHDHQYDPLGEFCTDFGDFRVTITLPDHYWVAATGTMVDSTGSNTPPTLAEARAARGGEKSREGEPGKGEKPGTKTLVFAASRVRDFAWAASPNYCLATAESEGVTIKNFFFPEDAKGWEKAADWAAEALSLFNERFGRYPYANFTICELRMGAFSNWAMEYPQLIMNGSGTNVPWTRFAETTVVHELAHNWWPMVMGTNEYDETWLDEGFATFSELAYMEHKYGAQGSLVDAPHWLPFRLSVDERSYQELQYLQAVQLKVEEPILRRADERDDRLALMVADYSKSVWVLLMLGEVVGDEVRDDIIRTYYAEWQFRHPHTEDFVAVAERVSGRDLHGFFDAWLRTTRTCDYALGHVEKKRDGDVHRTEVPLLRRGEIIMPVDVEVTYADGTIEKRRVDGSPGRQLLTFTSTSRARSVAIDPERRLLEVDRFNNAKPGLPMRFHPLLTLSSTRERPVTYGPSLWHDQRDGLRLGAWIRTWRPGYGGYVPGGGRRELTAGVSYGRESGHINYSARYADHLRIGRRGLWEAGAWQKEGRGEFYFGISWLGVRNLSTWNHRQRFEMRLSRYSVFESGYGSPLHWASGTSNSLALHWQLRSRGHRWDNRLTASLKKAARFGAGDVDFAKGGVVTEFERRKLPGPFSCLRARAFAGAILAGNEPAQERIDISGESPIAADAWFAYSEGGLIRRIETDRVRRFYFKGGPQLRGYWDRAISADRFTAANLELGLPLRTFVFFDTGWGKRTRELRSGKDFGHRVLSDAGLGLNLGFLEFSFPWWLSDPAPGERHAKFRWNFWLAPLGPGF